jgi:hypothetical protein
MDQHVVIRSGIIHARIDLIEDNTDGTKQGFRQKLCSLRATEKVREMQTEQHRAIRLRT